MDWTDKHAGGWVSGCILGFGSIPVFVKLEWALNSRRTKFRRSTTISNNTRCLSALSSNFSSTFWVRVLAAVENSFEQDCEMISVGCLST